MLVGRRRVPITSAWLVPVLLSSVLLLVVAAGAAAAIESKTVSSFGRGLWWATSLITTVGFIGEPPETKLGAALSAVLMVLGFLVLAMVSASLAALFVRDEERPHDEAQEAANRVMLDTLERIEHRLTDLEQMLAAQGRPARPVVPSATTWSARRRRSGSS
jgi:voltage-gated potassium channel